MKEGKGGRKGEGRSGEGRKDRGGEGEGGMKGGRGKLWEIEVRKKGGGGM
jgi:hypothetical protein